MMFGYTFFDRLLRIPKGHAKAAISHDNKRPEPCASANSATSADCYIRNNKINYNHLLEICQLFFHNFVDIFLITATVQAT